MVQAQPLLDLINLESALSNFGAVETLFAGALKGPSGGVTAAADVNIWKAYLHYIRRQNPVGAGGTDDEAKRKIITDAYEFALKQCGVDREAGEVWAEYIAFVQEVKVGVHRSELAVLIKCRRRIPGKPKHNRTISERSTNGRSAYL